MHRHHQLSDVVQIYPASSATGFMLLPSPTNPCALRRKAARTFRQKRSFSCKLPFGAFIIERYWKEQAFSTTPTCTDITSSQMLSRFAQFRLQPASRYCPAQPIPVLSEGRQHEHFVRSEASVANYPLVPSSSKDIERSKLSAQHRHAPTSQALRCCPDLPSFACNRLHAIAQPNQSLCSQKEGSTNISSEARLQLQITLWCLHH